MGTFLKYYPLLTYYNAPLNAQFEKNFNSYLSPNIILASAGIFILIVNVDLNKRWYVRGIKFISHSSYGIYLIHVLILTFLAQIGISCKFNIPAIGILLTFIACSIISSTIIFFLNKLPFGKYITGSH